MINIKTVSFIMINILLIQKEKLSKNEKNKGLVIFFRLDEPFELNPSSRYFMINQIAKMQSCVIFVIRIELLFQILC